VLFFYVFLAPIVVEILFLIRLERSGEQIKKRLQRKAGNSS